MGEGEGETCVAVLSDGMMEMDNSKGIQIQLQNQWADSNTRIEACAEKQVDVVTTMPELAHCVDNKATEALPINVPEACVKNDPTGQASNAELERCSGKETREASNDDIFSEVSNPFLSPRDNTSSFQTISSQPAQVINNSHVGCGEITSSSGNTSAEESLSEEEHSRYHTPPTAVTSSFVLEIPKQFSTTGIRKITFKFSKLKEVQNDSTLGVQPVSNELTSGIYEVPTFGPPRHDNSEAEVNRWMQWDQGSRNPFLSASNMEMKMSKKVIPDSYPTNVKKLLSTKILEGARVKYVSTSGQRELTGIVKDCGYICGCTICNFSKVLSAYEFELHAGGKSRHPNNHIYLENGKPIYSIIQELKMAPLSALDAVVKDIAGSSLNEEYFQIWRESLQQPVGLDSTENNWLSKPSFSYPSGSRYQTHSMENDSNFGSTIAQGNLHHPMEPPEERKRIMKKPRSYLPSPALEQKKSAEGGAKRRDNDLHKLLFMPIGLPDGTDLAYYSKGKRILGGYKQGNGIVCNCCKMEISPSQFEAHAGWAAKRQPYRHIYTSSGLTLHDIALMLANGQSITTSYSDDMCAICGDGGKLVICGGCPRAFHGACLGLESVPASDWNCPFCREKFVPGRKASGESKPLVVRMKRVVKSPESEGGGCVVCRAPDFSVANFDDRTVLLCDQCEKEYHVGCLRKSGLCDLKELPKDKWFCCNECDKIYGTLQNFTSSGPTELSNPISVMLSRKLSEKGTVEASTDNIKWRILSGKSRFPEHLPLLSRAAAIFRECFDPIIAKSGRDLIPVMVYGRNISGQEFGGVYCIVLLVKSVVVSAGLLRVFGQEVAELPLVATSRENQGKGYFQALFSCIEGLLSSMSVRNLVLPAAEEAESMWTKKLGFQKMSDERMLKFTRDYQLTIFKGTSMLEKEVQHWTG